MHVSGCVGALCEPDWMASLFATDGTLLISLFCRTRISFDKCHLISKSMFRQTIDAWLLPRWGTELCARFVTTGNGRLTFRTQWRAVIRNETMKQQRSCATTYALCSNVVVLFFFNLHENTPLICCARSKRTFILYKSTIVKGIGEIWALFPIKQMEKHEHKSELDISILINMLNAHQTQRTRIKLLLHSKSNVECHRRSNPQINKSKLIFRFSFPLFQLH